MRVENNAKFPEIIEELNTSWKLKFAKLCLKNQLLDFCQKLQSSLQQKLGKIKKILEIFDFYLWSLCKNEIWKKLFRVVAREFLSCLTQM